jgi:hypothetical protein
VTQISPQVEDVLRRSRVEGTTLFLPPGQLDRELYEQVNDVLARLGGQWNRRVRGHVFKVDPAEKLAAVLETGKKPEKNPLDFFPTPPAVVEQMIVRAELRDGMGVLEPSAGEGAIATVLHRSRLRLVVDCVELDPERAATLRDLGLCVHEGDFLAYQTKGYDRVLMNPPFTAAGDALVYVAHIRHAFSLLRPGGRLVAIAPGGFDFRDHKRVAEFRAFVDATGGWQGLPHGTFTASGTEISTVMLWMDA